MGKGLTIIRELVKETHTGNVRLEKYMPTSLQAITNKSLRDKKHRFVNLFGILDEDFLLDSWRFLNKNSAAGIDEITAREYRVNLKANIRSLVKSVKEQRYRARLIKRVFIPKQDGRQRPLGLPATQDKLLQTGATRILNAIFEADFMDSSFGYRPGRGSRDAVQYASRKIQFGRYTYIVEADIKGFFDNINHDWLIRMLGERINDKSFIRLIRKWLKAKILLPEGVLEDSERGTPQGGIVSPVLANIYLHYVLDLWFEKVVKPHCRGDVFICRYADDFICGFQFKSDAERFYKALGNRLLKFGLSLAMDKTRILKFSRFHQGKSRFDFLGFEFCWGADLKGLPHLKRRTSRKKFQMGLKNLKIWMKKNRNYRLLRLFEGLNSKLRGHYNYYGVIGNWADLNRFYFLAMKIVFKWLNRRSQRRSFNYTQFNHALKRYGVLRPRITESRFTQPRFVFF